ncbi:hypothetical protein AWB74_06335 [Caballeronia arvi]|uniref:Metallo-beta-lactamase domain-containing protein n=1 Tax=Caballeronia arvi TaxID=1777135 RepID=A0A158KNH6_9BURK|nr:hypothetical protein [Caballeronia arvi]SAL82634.1 hypothetical protein AWB74_06335 [Caballeronia arvi]
MNNGQQKAVENVDVKRIARGVPQTGENLVKERKQHPIPDGRMYCKLEAVDAESDYHNNRRCVRLFGISEAQFVQSLEENSTNSTFDVFIMDIEWPAWEVLKLNDIYLTRDRFRDSEPEWLEVSYRSDVSADDGQAYAYPLFLGSAPTFLEIQRVVPIDGRAIPRSHTVPAVRPHHTPSSSHYVLDAFHVGQGMCSVFHNGKSGFVLDAGAGTPVIRKIYNQKSFVNEFMTLVKRLSPLSMVLSHFDVDHWRLLDWDAEFLDRVDKIFVPGNYPSLPFKSSIIKAKVTPITTATLLDDTVASANLRVVRSSPHFSNKNGECLVAVCRTRGKIALLPGDYTYRRFPTDGGSEMRALSAAKYDAVVVPHHGDAASADQVVNPVSDSSIAFFSAGTHSYYNHPKQESLDNHEDIGYVVINKKESTEIKQKRLLA